MMQLEKNLSQMDLNPFKDTKERILAKSIVQYRDFRTKAALEKMNYAGYSKSSAQQLFNIGTKYIRTGEYSSSNSHGFNKLKPFVDELLPKYTALRPKENEKRVVSNIRDNAGRKKKNTTVETIEKPQIIESFSYGLDINGKLELFATENERTGYIRALKDYSYEKIAYKLCHIKVEYGK